MQGGRQAGRQGENERQGGVWLVHMEVDGGGGCKGGTWWAEKYR